MIVLREYADSDLQRLVALANNKSVSRYLVSTFPYPYTTADGEWWIATGSKQNGAVTRAIDYQGLFVGSVAIAPQSGWRSHLGEIGYWVGEQYRGRGIASAAVNRMTDFGFEDLQLRKLYAPVLAPNSASMKVLTKCGYLLEAILRSEVRKEAMYFDIHRFARHRPS